MMTILFYLEGLMIAIMGSQYSEPTIFKEVYSRTYEVSLFDESIGECETIHYWSRVLYSVDQFPDHGIFALRMKTLELTQLCSLLN
jgi:hypothetical protein